MILKIFLVSVNPHIKCLNCLRVNSFENGMVPLSVAVRSNVNIEMCLHY